MMSCLGLRVGIRLRTKYNSCSAFRGVFLCGSNPELGMLSVCFSLWRQRMRSLHLAPWRSSKADPPAEAGRASAQPIRFSTSKGSHRAWTVGRSMGGTFQRPWWKVFPVSLAAVGFLVWVVSHNRSDSDVPAKKKAVQTPA